MGEKYLQIEHEGIIYDVKIKLFDSKGLIDRIPNKTILASYEFYRNNEEIASAEVRSNKHMCEIMLCYTNDLEEILAYKASNSLEKSDPAFWERCNWNFPINYNELNSDSDSEELRVNNTFKDLP